MSNQSESEVWYTIEPDQRGEGVWAVEHGEYSESSVLAGYPRRALLRWYATAQEAQAEYPQAEILQWTTKDTYAGLELPHTPPAWFDEMDAGERWDDDY